MSYSEHRSPSPQFTPRRLPSSDESATGGTSLGMIAGSIAFIALIFGLAFYFNGDGDGGANIATNKNPAGISAPTTTGPGASTTGSGAAGR